MPVAVKYTYEDILGLPEDRNRYELFDGELIVTPAPSVEHQIAVGNTFSLLSAHVRGRSLGLVIAAPVDIYFGEESVVRPDIVFVSSGRQAIVTKRRVEGECGSIGLLIQRHAPLKCTPLVTRAIGCRGSTGTKILYTLSFCRT